MKTETLLLDEAMSSAADTKADGTLRFPFAMIQTYSRIYLGFNPLDDNETDPAKNNSEDWLSFFQDERKWKQSLLEARFFSETEELRVYREDNGFQAALSEEADGDRWLEETCEIANKEKFGAFVTVRRLIGFDEDGQAYVVFTRLSGWKEAEKRG